LTAELTADGWFSLIFDDIFDRHCFHIFYYFHAID
jgi:hypothetical protein